ncbi:hypothetical protein [Streptomyces sp. NBC_01244]|uniref:hypothetical protein n=1 Tax=Streptomyces sp. NBC_01244 TaxID=2903797 RepID=UPI002E135393|nr:hypothetical protein OG247_01390 [Streptomyces sp. NBC_01244]
MATIEIPLDELKDVIKLLSDIQERIETKTGLQRVGSEQDVGDPALIKAVNDFDGAWKAGHERVQENVEAFREANQGVIDNFEKTDSETTSGFE